LSNFFFLASLHFSHQVQLDVENIHIEDHSSAFFLGL
jgi:hypothetical protein